LFFGQLEASIWHNQISFQPCQKQQTPVFEENVHHAICEKEARFRFEKMAAGTMQLEHFCF
jgi:hypothetical protein